VRDSYRRDESRRSVRERHTNGFSPCAPTTRLPARLPAGAPLRNDQPVAGRVEYEVGEASALRPSRSSRLLALAAICYAHAKCGRRRWRSFWQAWVVLRPCRCPRLPWSTANGRGCLQTCQGLYNQCMSTLAPGVACSVRAFNACRENLEGCYATSPD